MPDRSSFDFTNRRVVITGGTKGLGRATAEAFLTAGASVVVCARRPIDDVVEAAGREATFAACDVRDPESITTMIAEAATAMGGIDIVINNAGGSPAAAAKDSGGSFITKVVGLNLVGPINVAIAAHEWLERSTSHPVVVNISSVSGMRANPLGVAYGAAKAGLINMTQTLALEWGPHIRVLAVTAGPLDTEAARGYFGDEEMDRLAASLSLGRLGSSDDVVNAVLFACSPLASWMSGSNIVLDGGPEWPQGGYQDS